MTRVEPGGRGVGVASCEKRWARAERVQKATAQSSETRNLNAGFMFIAGRSSSS